MWFVSNITVARHEFCSHLRHIVFIFFYEGETNAIIIDGKNPREYKKEKKKKKFKL